MADVPPRNQRPTATEHSVIRAAQASQSSCSCGEVHADGSGVTPAVMARMRGYLAAHPGHQFAVDDEAGLVAVITSDDSGHPKIIAQSNDLAALLDTVGAPAAENLS